MGQVGAFDSFVNHLSGGDQIDLVGVVGGVSETIGAALLDEKGQYPFVAFDTNQHLTTGEIVAKAASMPSAGGVNVIVPIYTVFQQQYPSAAAFKKPICNSL